MRVTLAIDSGLVTFYSLPVGEETEDGRRARRERGRRAVIDAAFALIIDGAAPFAVEDVAARAGVSVSSVYRNFDSLVDLQRLALAQFDARYMHLLTATPPPGADFAARVEFFVRHRISLYEQAGPLMKMARIRALDHETMVDAVVEHRRALAEQTRECFGPEIAHRTTADAASLVSVIDSLTSPESFDLMTGTHARTSRQVARSWRLGLHALIAASPPPRRTRGTGTARGR